MLDLFHGLPADPAPPEPIQNPHVRANMYSGTAAYNAWMAAGQPWQPAQPVRDIAATLRGYGYTVYIIGDQSHLTAATPEDHCPFSVTGWPVASPRWWVHACDIMPGGAIPLPDLAAQLAADRTSLYPPAGWLKYMNWTTSGGSCIHQSWEPSLNTVNSTDIGHIHLSVRSDTTYSTIAAGYDPVARWRTNGPPLPPPNVIAPPWPGRYLTYTPGRQMMTGSDVRRWQQRMTDRGWRLGTVDGVYGPTSATICRQFQTEKRLTCDGIVGPATWTAAWNATIT